MAEEEEFNPAATSPSQEVVEYLTAQRRIQNPDDVVGMCSECKSTQPDSAMTKSVFAQEGVPPVCKYCGGVVVIVYAEQQGDSLNRSLDISRGLG